MPAGFTKSRRKFEARPEELLIRRTAEEKQSLIDEGLGLLADPYDLTAAGVYPDEVVYDLSDGSGTVAVSVETFWKENGSGPTFIGYARLINEDGSTQTTFDDKQIEVAWSCHPDGGTMARLLESGHTVNDIASDVMRVMMGNDPTITIENVVDAETGATELVPWIQPNDEGRMNANIKLQLDLVRQTEGFPKLSL